MIKANISTSASCAQPPENLIGEIAGIPAERKQLVIEQSNMAFAIAQKLRGYTDRLVVCDPRHNKLVTQSAKKMTALIPSAYAGCYGSMRSAGSTGHPWSEVPIPQMPG